MWHAHPVWRFYPLFNTLTHIFTTMPSALHLQPPGNCLPRPCHSDLRVYLASLSVVAHCIHFHFFHIKCAQRHCQLMWRIKCTFQRYISNFFCACAPANGHQLRISLHLCMRVYLECACNEINCQRLIFSTPTVLFTNMGRCCHLWCARLNWATSIMAYHCPPRPCITNMFTYRI